MSRPLLDHKAAASIFRCPQTFVKPFSQKDPFNEDNTVGGFLCTRPGLMEGSIIIVEVNGKETPPQLIADCPRLADPHYPGTKTLIKLKAHSFYFSEKWDGINVLFFHYRDADGKTKMTAKSHLTPFLQGKEFGMVQEAIMPFYVIPEICSFLGKRKVAAVNYILCGTRTHKKVTYKFPLSLKPVFTVSTEGHIKPVVQSLGDHGPQLVPRNRLYHGIIPEAAAQICGLNQSLDHQANEEAKKTDGIGAVWTLGKVIYPMDVDGYVLGRVLYDLKPLSV